MPALRAPPKAPALAPTLALALAPAPAPLRNRATLRALVGFTLAAIFLAAAFSGDRGPTCEEPGRCRSLSPMLGGVGGAGVAFGLAGLVLVAAGVGFGRLGSTVLGVVGGTFTLLAAYAWWRIPSPVPPALELVILPVGWAVAWGVSRLPARLGGPALALLGILVIRVQRELAEAASGIAGWPVAVWAVLFAAPVILAVQANSGRPPAVGA